MRRAKHHEEGSMLYKPLAARAAINQRDLQLCHAQLYQRHGYCSDVFYGITERWTDFPYCISVSHLYPTQIYPYPQNSTVPISHAL